MNNKKIINNCSLIRDYHKIEGVPEIVDGKCVGYQKGTNDDEPCAKCMDCKANVWYEE